MYLAGTGTLRIGSPAGALLALKGRVRLSDGTDNGWYQALGRGVYPGLRRNGCGLPASAPRGIVGGLDACPGNRDRGM